MLWLADDFAIPAHNGFIQLKNATPAGALEPVLSLSKDPSPLGAGEINAIALRW